MTRRTMVSFLGAFFSRSISSLAELSTDMNAQHIPLMSLIQVISNNQEIDNQHLKVLGYLAHNGLDRAIGIFLSEADGINCIIPNSIDLRIDEAAARGFLGKYVIVAGVYHAPPLRASYNGYIVPTADLKIWRADNPLK